MDYSDLTERDRTLLAPFVTNLDRPVFALTPALPPVVAGASFSRYSRTKKHLRRLLVDEFLAEYGAGWEALVQTLVERGLSCDKAGELAGEIQEKFLDPSGAIEKGESFYTRVLAEYGDESINELMGAHVALEGVSNIVAKVIEDSRLISPLEKSTRYVIWEEGDYYREPRLMASEWRDLYLKVNDLAFRTYANLFGPLQEDLYGRFPLEEEEVLDPQTGEETTIGRLTDEKARKAAEGAYRRTIRAKTCDALRYLLTGATRTNMGVFANGRSHEALIMGLMAHELTEAREVGEAIYEELMKVIPSSVRRIKDQVKQYGERQVEHLRHLRERARTEAEALGARSPAGEVSPVRLLEFEDREAAEVKVLAGWLFEESHEPLDRLRDRVARMSDEERRRLVSDLLGKRSNYRHKPPRAFELTGYLFEFMADYGAYRDLQRHRMLTQARQLLTTYHGYELPEALLEADEARPEVRFRAEFEAVMTEADEAYRKIAPDFPAEAQYLVPFAYRIRWYKRLSLREAYHLCELRSSPQGHPSYRRLAQAVADAIQQVHPLLAGGMMVEQAAVDLERYAAEVKTAMQRLPST